MEMDVNCVDYMHLSMSHCRLWTACSGCYTKVKKEIQILYIKKELKLTGRGSAMFS